jgi:hypothetical protein
MRGRAPAPAEADAANEVSRALERRLRGQTQGEVHFDTASRGRYSTDASIY